MPTTVPVMAMRTASTRMLVRTCLRLMPTARSRPSSWVRSRIDRPSVLTTPNTAMITAKASSA